MVKEVFTSERYSILEYTPTIFHPFYNDMEPLGIGKRIRFFIEWFYGYKVFYLKEKNGGEIVAYCTVTSGKNPRYWFARNKDIIIGPYFTNPKYRGCGYAGCLVKTVIQELETNWNNAYAYIWKTKIASRKIMESVGGKFVMNVRNNKLHRLVEKEDGEYAVYQVIKNRKEGKIYE